MKKAKSKLKYSIPWLILIPVVMLLLAGTIYLNRQTITLPLEYEDEEYVLRYGTRFLGYWDEGDFYAKKSAMEATYTMHSPMKIKKEQVEQLMECLDLRKINLRKRMKAWDEGGEKEVTEITKKEAFQLYGLYSGNVLLIITEDGEIYVKGYRYLGDKKKFIEKIKSFFHDLEVDWLSEEEKAFLEDVINQIEWK